MHVIGLAVFKVGLILLALIGLFLLFHFTAKSPSKKERERLIKKGDPAIVDYVSTPHEDSAKIAGVIEVPLRPNGMKNPSLNECLAAIKEIPLHDKPEKIDAEAWISRSSISKGLDPKTVYHIDWATGPDRTARAAPRMCSIDEEMYDFITKCPPAFTGVNYPKPIFLSYYCDQEPSQPAWLRYRDCKGHFIKKGLAMDLFNLRTALEPYAQYREQAFMIDDKIYRVADR